MRATATESVAITRKQQSGARRAASGALALCPKRKWRPSRYGIRLRHTPAGRVSAPLEASVRVIASAPVALVDHARAERPGLDQVERDVFGDRQ